jgi:magnesium-transporting ATPase (P-type)
MTKEKYKDILLDKFLSKASSSKNSSEKKKTFPKKTPKKIFNKSGVFVIIIAIFAIISIQFLPWMYLKYESDQGVEEYYVGLDFKVDSSSEAEMNNNVRNLFDAPHSTNGPFSGSYMGLKIVDFTDIPKTSFNLFVILIIISIIFTLIMVLHHFKNLNFFNVTIIFSAFAIGCILICLFIFILALKFISSYLVLYLNDVYIQSLGITDIRLVYIVPLILFFLTFMIIKSCSTIIRINFRDISKKMEFEISENRYQSFKLGVSNNE